MSPLMAHRPSALYKIQITLAKQGFKVRITSPNCLWYMLDLFLYTKDIFVLFFEEKNPKKTKLQWRDDIIREPSTLID